MEKNTSFRSLIFDLDDTLVDTEKLLVPDALNDALKNLSQLGITTSLQELLKLRKEYKQSHKSNFWTFLGERLSKNASVSKEIIATEARKGFLCRDIKNPIKPITKALETLSYLHTRYVCFLVTAGYPATQKQKVALLKISHFFNHIWYVNVFEKETKKRAFLKILKQTEFKPHQILSIGNTLHSEIAEAKQLGMSTCLVRLHVEDKFIPKRPEETPDMVVTNMKELLVQCHL